MTNCYNRAMRMFRQLLNMGGGALVLRGARNSNSHPISRPLDFGVSMAVALS